METLIYRGDHKTDARGIPVEVTGDEELAQQVMIRLSVPLGSFELDRSLGSLLHTLPKTDSPKNVERAKRYIESALVDMGYLEVQDVTCLYNGALDRLKIGFRVVLENSFVDMEVSV